MFNPRIWSLACLVGATVLGGCVADGPLSVAPGQGKTYADLQRDDAACRAGPTAAPTAAVSAPTTTPAAGGTYYQCMAAKGQMVVANRTVAYPAYAYAPYPYGYAYPYGYPYFGYPYSAAYVGIGLGFGGGFYRDRFYGGRGFYGGYRRR